jgi:hypothetical protein
MCSLKVTKSGIKRILKHHQPQIRVGHRVETLVYLNYLLFLKKLAQQTSISMDEHGIKAKKSTASDIERVSKKLLEEFRG